MQDEVTRKQTQLSRRIKQGQALSSLEGFEGWRVVKGWIEGSIKAAESGVFDSKKVKNWNDFLIMKGEHQYAVKLLFLVENGIRLGKSAADRLKDAG